MDHILQLNATDQLDIAGVLVQMVLRSLELVVLLDKDNHNAVLFHKLISLQHPLHAFKQDHQALDFWEHLFHNVKLMDLSLQCNAMDQLDIVGVLIQMVLRKLELELHLDKDNHNAILVFLVLKQLLKECQEHLLQDVKLMDRSLQCNAMDQLDIVGVLIQVVLRSVALVVLLVLDNHNALHKKLKKHFSFFFVSSLFSFLLFFFSLSSFSLTFFLFHPFLFPFFLSTILSFWRK